MKKILLVAVVVIGSVLLWNYAKPDDVIKTVTHTVQTNTPKINSQKVQKQYIFVPYWSFTRSIIADSESTLIYFGIGVNSQGIELGDKGYENLKTFIKLTPTSSERFLSIRMTDKNINADVIKSLESQEKIASAAVSLALENKFDGVLLDYETSAFGFDTTTNNITSFYKRFSDKVKSSKLLFYVTLYGDTYFRARPFNVKKIGEMSDKVLVMTYDFSKSRGNPGPNFPLMDNGTYGYDLEKMIDDFQKDVDNSKLVIVLGYFGYDWRVDKDGNAISTGVPMSNNEISKEFLKECKYDSCTIKRSPNTSEPSINYTDDSGERHIVWFEDIKSSNKKKELLKKRGILETAAWAYSYY